MWILISNFFLQQSYILIHFFVVEIMCSKRKRNDFYILSLLLLLHIFFFFRCFICSKTLVVFNYIRFFLLLLLLSYSYPSRCSRGSSSLRLSLYSMKLSSDNAANVWFTLKLFSHVSFLIINNSDHKLQNLFCIQTYQTRTTTGHSVNNKRRKKKRLERQRNDL